MPHSSGAPIGQSTYHDSRFQADLDEPERLFASCCRHRIELKRDRQIQAEFGIFMTESAPFFGKGNLADCDREPIRIPGSIQPHGLLLALDPDSMTVVQVAGDTQRLLGETHEQLLGRSLAASLGAATLAGVETMLRKHPASPRPSLIVEAVFDGRPLEISAHLSDGLVILELEPRPQDLGLNVIEAVQAMTARAASTELLPELLRVVVDEVAAASGFDRVMLYRFLDDDSGHVVAEHRRSLTVESFLDLHYPASDIPAQARELYCINWIRSIPDVSYQPQPLDPPDNPLTGRPLDLGLSTLRSVSPVHLEYLSNMGIAASMSLSLVVGGKLWGMVACHHNQALYLSARTRAVLALFAQLVSLQIRCHVDLAQTSAVIRARDVQTQLTVAMNHSGFPGLVSAEAGLLDLIPALGAALFIDGKITLCGKTPTESEIEGLAQWLRETRVDAAYATDRLSEHYLPAAGFLGSAAGLLAVIFSRTPYNYVLWFLPELIATVTWAGCPTKPVVHGPLGDRLTPRKSFAAWTETARGRSRPWTAVEIQSATALGANAALELRVADRTRSLVDANRKLQSIVDRRESLIDELTTSNVDRGEIVRRLGEREVELRQTSQRHRQLLDGVDDYAIYWLDTTGHVESWNAGAQRMKGYKESEIIGAHYSIFFSADDRAAGEPERILSTALSQGRCSAEGWRIRNDGSAFWSEITVEAVRDEAGHLIGFANISRDVSERRALERSRKEAHDELQGKTRDLAASEEQYSLAVKGMSVGVWDWDIAKNNLFLSERFKEIIGVTETRVNFDLDEIADRLHPEDKEATLESLRRHVEKKNTFDVEHRLRHELGHYVWVHGTAQAIWNDGGEVRRVSGSVADISEFKRQQQALKESEETFRKAIENAVVGNALVATDGQWLKVNRALCNLLGFEEAELLEAGDSQIQHPDDPTDIRETLEDLMSGASSVVERERILRHRDGHPLWVKVCASMVTRGDRAPDCFMVQFQDMTEAKRAELIKDEFVSTVNHELRTPLTSIFASLKLLGATTAGKLEARAERLLEVAQISCAQLTGLVNDILDLERIAAGKMDYQMQTLPARPLIQDIIDRHGAIADQHNVRFNTHLALGDLAIRVDPSRLNQALVNLLSNAAKYSPSGGQIDIVAKLDGAASIRISVTDHGPGVPEAFRSRIFGRFAQADNSTTRRVGGSGLGLNITKTLIEAFGGTVSFDSVEGQGATFHFVLPASNILEREAELHAHD